MRGRLLSATIGLALLVSLFSVPTMGAAEPLRIGVITSLTGRFATFGKMQMAGYSVLLGAGDVFRNYFQQANLLIYGVLIILIVRFAPEGIVGGWQFLARRWPRGRRIAAQPAE